MICPLHTPFEQFSIQLDVQSISPSQLSIAVFDPSRPFTFFLKRKVSFQDSTRRTLEIPVPLRSEKMQLLITDHKGDDSIRINSLEIKPLNKEDLWASGQQHDFMKFANQFALRAGYNPPGFYRDKSNRFYIQYVERIRNQLGFPLITPARIQRGRPFIQIAKQQFIHYSIPVRVAILAHEGCHYFLDSRSETEADLCALRYYLQAGFPKIEAVYAMTKVFRFFDAPLSKQQVLRAKAAIEYIKQYRNDNLTISQA